MAEAQRLIGISLAKIAQSRVCRGGVSLHKNLLVATVLQKARYIFMEEAYHIVHGHYLQHNKCMEMEMEKQKNNMINNDNDINSSESEGNDNGDTYSSKDNNKFCDDKENSPPSEEDATTPPTSSALVFFDMDVKKVEKESSNKRRREIAEWETEEAVLSILPKRIKSDSSDSSSSSSDSESDFYNQDSEDSESVFLEEATALSEAVAKEFQSEELVAAKNEQILTNTPSVESIDRITSLVSIFSFGSLSRSVSTPDFCSAQAKDSENALAQLQHSPRSFLTMTV